MSYNSLMTPAGSWEYNKLHKSRRVSLENGLSQLNLTSPEMLASSYLKLHKIKDSRATERMFKENLKLFTKLMCPNKFRGFSQNKCRPVKSDYLLRDARRIAQIEKDNRKMASKVLRTKSSVHIRRGVEEVKAKKRVHKVSISQVTLQEHMEFLNYYEPSVMEKLLRPKIFIDLYVKNIRPLGRLIIQLCTEACPEFVLELVRMCSYEKLDNLQFIRIFPVLWLEAELKVAEHVLNAPGYLFNMNCVDHGQGPGILSFANCYLNGFPSGLLNFSISFKALSVLNGERVPFGFVSQGLKVLDCVQDYGTKNGKSKKDIIVVGCGVIQ